MDFVEKSIARCREFLKHHDVASSGDYPINNNNTNNEDYEGDIPDSNKVIQYTNNSNSNGGVNSGGRVGDSNGFSPGRDVVYTHEQVFYDTRFQDQSTGYQNQAFTNNGRASRQRASSEMQQTDLRAMSSTSQQIQSNAGLTSAGGLGIIGSSNSSRSSTPISTQRLSRVDPNLPRVAQMLDSIQIKEQQRRRQQEENSIDPACTFTPSVNGTTRVGGTKIRKSSDTIYSSRKVGARSTTPSAYERLYKAGSDRHVLYEQAHIEAEQQELLRRKQKKGDAAVFERLSSEGNKMRRAAISNAAKEEAQNSMPLTPTISKKSKQLAEKARQRLAEEQSLEQLSLEDRLCLEANILRNKKAQLKAEYYAREEERLREEQRLANKTNSCYCGVGNMGRSAMDNQTFEDRIKEHEERKMHNLNHLKRIEERKYTFVPRINKESTDTTHISVFDRSRLFPPGLNGPNGPNGLGASTTLVSVKRELEQELTFHPKIDGNSRAMAEALKEMGNSDVDYALRRSQLANTIRKEKEKECTFRPKITEWGNLVEPKIAIKDPKEFMDTVKQMMEKKEIEIRKQKEEQETSEMKRCTFKPKIKPMPSSVNTPVCVPGVGRHLELMENSRRQLEDKRLREREVFGTPSYNGPVPTVPVPFALSVGVGVPRRNVGLGQQLFGEAGERGERGDRGETGAGGVVTRAEIERMIINDEWDSGDGV